MDCSTLLQPTCSGNAEGAEAGPNDHASCTLSSSEVRLLSLKGLHRPICQIAARSLADGCEASLGWASGMMIYESSIMNLRCRSALRAPSSLRIYAQAVQTHDPIANSAGDVPILDPAPRQKRFVRAVAAVSSSTCGVLLRHLLV